MSVIGKALSRIDGPLKLTGSARYSSDHSFANMLYGVVVGSSIANGRVTAIDAAAALKMPGVVEIFHRDNIPALYKSSPEAGPIDESRPPFADDVVRYYGQYVALVVAETFEEAAAAAACVNVTYADVASPNVALELSPDSEPEQRSRRGDPEAAFAAAPVKVDQTYVTPVETHNAIELHASVAVPDGEQITLYNTTQAVVNSHNVLSRRRRPPARAPGQSGFEPQTEFRVGRSSRSNPTARPHVRRARRNVDFAAPRIRQPSRRLRGVRRELW